MLPGHTPIFLDCLDIHFLEQVSIFVYSHNPRKKKEIEIMQLDQYYNNAFYIYHLYINGRQLECTPMSSKEVSPGWAHPNRCGEMPCCLTAIFSK
jgi:hypothetical protein